MRLLLTLLLVGLAIETDILTETFAFDDTTNESVALTDLKQGCPAKRHR